MASDPKKRRRLQRASAGKGIRRRGAYLTEQAGRKQAREAWNQRRALARAKSRLQTLMIAKFGMKPLRRLCGKQPRHSLDDACAADRSNPGMVMKPTRRITGKTRFSEAHSSRSSRAQPNPCSGRVTADDSVLSWASDVACHGSCGPSTVASSPPASIEEPLDQGMLDLIEDQMALERQQRARTDDQCRFRSLAEHLGIRVG